MTEPVSSNGLSPEDLRDELRRLMIEHIESMKSETFGGLDDEGLLRQEAQLNHIREISARFLAAAKKNRGWTDKG